MNETLFGLAVIALSLLAALISLATGRVRFNAAWYVHRADKPLIFWLAILGSVLIGVVIVTHGLR